MVSAFKYLVEFEGTHKRNGLLEVFRVANQGGFTTAPTDSPADTTYDDVLQQPIKIGRNAFALGSTSGAVKVNRGDAVINNLDGQLDRTMSYYFGGGSVRVYRGPVNATSLSQFTQVFTGTMDSIQRTIQTVTLKLRDAQALLDYPIQANTYGGTNVLPNGVDGVAGDLKDHKKPLVFGRVFNATPVLVNSAQLIYQVHDGALAEMSAVYDRGVALTFAGNYATLSDLGSEALSPLPSQYKTYLAGGMVKVGSVPSELTIDCAQGATVSERTASSIFRAIAQRMGLMDSDLLVSDFFTMQAAQPAELGRYVNEEIKASVLLDELARTAGAWFGPNNDSMIRFVRLERPRGASVFTITANDIKGRSPIQQPTSDPERGLVAYSVKMSYAHNNTVQTNSLAETDDETVLSQARRGFLALADRYAEESDSNILTIYKNAQALVYATWFTTEADARAAAAFELALRRVERFRYDFDLTLDDETVSLDIGDIVNFAYPRFAIALAGSDGRPFRILGIEQDAATGRDAITIWGNAQIARNRATKTGKLFVTKAPRRYFITQDA